MEKKTFILQDETYRNLRTSLLGLVEDLPGEVLTPIGYILVDATNPRKVTFLFGPGADDEELVQTIEGAKNPSVAIIDSPRLKAIRAREPKDGANFSHHAD
jgi:hypothetical protein